MIVTLQTERVRTLDQVRAFVEGSEAVDFAGAERESVYEFVRRALVRLGYERLGKSDKGLVRRSLAKVTGLSRAQLTRLIGQHRETGRIEDRRGGASACPFERRYTRADIGQLAAVDAALGQMSGPATRALMRRQYAVFGDERFERLAGLSNGHLYNLSRSVTYRRRRTVVAKTQATHSTIGHRRKPQPDGQPGYVRVDTVHQGDQDGAKGVYHINAVDEVTQFQFVGTVEAISERFLLPVLEGLIEAFPFVIQGIHADNGSEYINHRVAALLNKLRIGEFTKSRPRHCNDNAPRSSRGQALAESKNAGVVRKSIGHGHIPRRFAPLVNECSLRDSRGGSLPYGIRLFLRTGKQEVRQSEEHVLTMFPVLRERIRQIAGTLSGGEQQMLAMARSLMSKPRVLLLDEPSMGLAPMLVETIFEAVLAIRNEGVPVLLVEQNAFMALQIADRGYVVETGEIVLEGAGRELLESDEVRRAYLG